MQLIERGPVRPWRDIARAAAAGTLLTLPLALLLGALAFPGWGDTLASFALVFAFFLPLGLVFRLLLHGLHRYANAGFHPEPAWPVLVYSRPVLAVGAFSAAAYALLAAASGLSTGDWSP